MTTNYLNWVAAERAKQAEKEADINRKVAAENADIQLVSQVVAMALMAVFLIFL